MVEKAYQKAVLLAAGETNLPIKTFPPDCCYSLEEILSDRFYPGEPAAEDLMEWGMNGALGEKMSVSICLG